MISRMPDRGIDSTARDGLAMGHPPPRSDVRSLPGQSRPVAQPGPPERYRPRPAAGRPRPVNSGPCGASGGPDRRRPPGSGPPSDRVPAPHWPIRLPYSPGAGGRSPLRPDRSRPKRNVTSAWHSMAERWISASPWARWASPRDHHASIHPGLEDHGGACCHLGQVDVAQELHALPERHHRVTGGRHPQRADEGSVWNRHRSPTGRDLHPVAPAVADDGLRGEGRVESGSGGHVPEAGDGGAGDVFDVPPRHNPPLVPLLWRSVRSTGLAPPMRSITSSSVS